MFSKKKGSLRVLGGTVRGGVSGPVEQVSKLAGGTGTDEMPEPGEINALFEQFLTELALPPQKLEQMRLMPVDRKWTLLQQHKTKGSDIPVLHDPRVFVELLSQTLPPAELSKDLQSLEVSLRTEPIHWVKDFVTAGGLPILLNILKGLCGVENPTKDHRDALLHCTRAVRAQMNNTYGLQATMSHPDGINILALVLTSPVLKAQTIALEVLAAVCFVPPDGHALILRAMEYCVGVRKKGGKRFEGLVRSLGAETVGDEDAALYLEYQIACLSFINAIVNSPEDLEFRVCLRNEFMGLKIVDILPALRSIDHDTLNTQLHIFEEEAAADYDALFEHLELDRIDMQNADELFGALKRELEGTDCWPWFLRVLQHLLVVPNDEYRGSKYWHVLSLCLSQLILQRNGFNPDVAVLNIDVSSVVDGLVKLDSDPSLSSSQEIKVKERPKSGELEKAVKMCKELENIVKRKDEEIKGLREKGAGVGGSTETLVASESTVDITKAPLPPGAVLSADLKDALQKYVDEVVGALKQSTKPSSGAPPSTIPSAPGKAPPPPPPKPQDLQNPTSPVKGPPPPPP
ncbi:Diaphanous, partial [Borealophlyctis nickersoniae]